MIDTDLIVNLLRHHGHTVEAVVPVANDAGEYEFSIDGTLLSLAETRQLLEHEDARKRASRLSHHPSSQLSKPVGPH